MLGQRKHKDEDLTELDAVLDVYKAKTKRRVQEDYRNGNDWMEHYFERTELIHTAKNPGKKADKFAVYVDSLQDMLSGEVHNHYAQRLDMALETINYINSELPNDACRTTARIKKQMQDLVEKYVTNNEYLNKKTGLKDKIDKVKSAVEYIQPVTQTENYSSANAA